MYLAEDDADDEEVCLEEEAVDPLIGMTFHFTPSAPKDDAPRGGQGSQVLPVADYLDDSFDRDPEDGLEYLFTVRCVARAFSLAPWKE